LPAARSADALLRRAQSALDRRGLGAMLVRMTAAAPRRLPFRIAWLGLH
jgi:hypothetical protein